MTIHKRLGKRSTTYKSVCMVNGKRINKTFKSLQDAKLHEAKLLTDSDYANRLTFDITLTLQSVINQFSDWYHGIEIDRNGKPIKVEGNNKPQMRGKDWKTLRHRLSRWSKTLGHKPIGKITSDDILDFIDVLKSEGKAPATINRYKSALSKLYLFAIEERKIIKTNPCGEVKHLPENNQKEKFLTEDEVSDLLSACRNSDWDRLYLIVLMAVTTGARRGELIELTWDKINFHSNVALLEETKNGTSRTITLTPRVIAELKKFQGISGYVFPNPFKIGKFYEHFVWHYHKALKQIGIEGFRFHDLRHTAASRLASNGVMLKEVGDILGHKSIVSTSRYVHFSDQHKNDTVNRVMGDIQ